MENESKKVQEIENTNIENNAKEEKRCVKCNNVMNEEYRFCTICGADQVVKPVQMSKPKKKKQKLKSYQIALISSFITLLICLASTFCLVMYLDQNNVNIDTSNRNVTVNDTGLADAVEKIYDAVVVVENYVNGTTKNYQTKLSQMGLNISNGIAGLIKTGVDGFFKYIGNAVTQ